MLRVPYLSIPDIPIYATDEVAEALKHTGMVHATGFSHEEVMDVTNENFDELFWRLPSHEQVIAGGLSARMFVSLYPFLIAKLRNRISHEQLRQAVMRVTGQTASAVVSRLLYAAALGPVFGWYLLARGAMLASGGLASMREDVSTEVKRVVLADKSNTTMTAN